MSRSDDWHFTVIVSTVAVFVSFVLLASASTRAEGANAGEEVEIGITVVIQGHVTGTLGDKKRRLSRGVRVFSKEELETRALSQLELKLDDDTKLALGPNARLRLDDYVTDRSGGVTRITVKFLQGAFRFITGQNESKVYRIETPSATIGVLGTVFDLFNTKLGDSFVLLHEGKLEICLRTRSHQHGLWRQCYQHNANGRIVHVSTTGVVSAPSKWTAKLIPGIGLTRAFPFVGHRLEIDPVLRSLRP